MGDGALGTATLHEPKLVLWLHDRLVIADGCSLREMVDGRVSTTLGAPTACAEQDAEEVIQPVPWASKIKRFVMLAGSAEGTAIPTVLALTDSQVVRVALASSGDAASCAGLLSEDACVYLHGCGWAEGDAANQRACLNCIGLEQWAGSHAEACALEGAPKAGTRYSLEGCDCEQPVPDPDDEGVTIHHVVIWACLVAATFVAIVAVALFMYRSRRRVAALEILDRNSGEVAMVDSGYSGHMADAMSEYSESEYHAFTDDE